MPAMYLSHPKSEVEGGLLPVRKKLWKGVVRRKSDEAILWQCKHNHSRPEFNARFVVDKDRYDNDIFGVWEESALNCGRAAYRQWGEESVTGAIGAVGNPNISIAMRPDIRFARVGDRAFVGKVELNDNGHRILEVKDYVENAYPRYIARLNLDVSPKKGLTFPDMESSLAQEYLTAIWLLKGGIWGTIFQDHKVRMEAAAPMPNAVEELLGPVSSPGKGRGLTLPASVPKKRKGVKKQAQQEREANGKPRIEIATKNGRRVFEVITSNGVVDGAFYHRGKAVEALERLR